MQLHKLLNFVLSGLFLSCASMVFGQTEIDDFDPNASGFVRTILVQPDGKILIGGVFSAIAGTSRVGIARLNSDGTLDTAFNPNANDQIFSIALQPDGKVLVGGQFTTIGGQLRNKFARLDATTGQADSLSPNPVGPVLAIAVQPDGKIIVGGAFSGANSIGGQTRNHIARLDPITGLVDSFDPNVGGTVFSVAVQSDGKVLASGVFIEAGGQTRQSIARFDGTTAVLDSFNPNTQYPASLQWLCRVTERF